MVKAAVMSAPLKPLEICDFSIPRLENGAALLQTIASEVCGTDLHLYKGHLPEVPYPIIPRHVSVGVVESIKGKITVQTRNTVDEGDTVTFLDRKGTISLHFQ